jgi:hypothetical protein
MRKFATVLLLAAAASARADTLADVKRTLATLRGTSPIAAAYDLRKTNKARGRFFTQDLNVHSAADVHSGEAGVTVTLSHATIERLRSQRAAGRRDRTSSAEVAGDVSPSTVAELLDFAPTLQGMLAHAALRGEREAAVGGVSARLVTLKIPPERSPSKDVKLESDGDDLSLWIGRDGVPIAAERNAQFSVGFLFLKATGTAKEKWTFVRRDDRLVVVRHERAMSGGGLGESSEGMETESLVLR